MSKSVEVVKNIILNIADPVSKKFLIKRLRSATQLYRTRSHVISESVVNGEYRATIVSLGKGKRYVNQQTLFGTQALLHAPPELFHYVRVSPERLKCTCEDAVFISSRIAKATGKKQIRVVICKHVLFGIMRALDLNVITPSDAKKLIRKFSNQLHPSMNLECKVHC